MLHPDPYETMRIRNTGLMIKRFIQKVSFLVSRKATDKKKLRELI